MEAADGTGETTVAFATSGNGIVITDTAGGPDAPTITPANFSTAAADLGLNEPAAGNVITGTDVNQVTSAGVFSHLSNLRDALRGNNLASITSASEHLAEDLDQVVRVRGETGARVQELEQRETRIEDQNVATASLLSSLEDVDITEAVARFQTLQTALQANLQSSGAILNLSLLDFLG